MKIDMENEEELVKLRNALIQRDKEECLASASLTTEILSQLNVSIDALPQRCQQIVHQCASLQAELDQSLDPIAISVRQTKELTQKMEEDLELLELRQKNADLRRQIERNKVFIDELKRELRSAKESLSSQNTSPENMPEHIRQLKQKVASYEEYYEKAKAKFTKLHVPEGILPKSLEALSARLAALREEESALKLRADDVTLARQARHTLALLRGG